MEQEKGSVTLYVTLSCIILVTVLSLTVFNVTNRNNNQKKQLEKITDNYSVSDDDMEQAYGEVGEEGEEETRYVTLEEVEKLLENVKKEAKLEIYPVGSIYMSTSPTNPADLFGGEWESYGEGRTLIGVGNNGTSNYEVEGKGGSEQHTHTGTSGGPSTNETGSTILTVEQMPSHTHIQNAHRHTSFMYMGGYSGWNLGNTPNNFYVFKYDSAAILNPSSGSIHTNFSIKGVGLTDDVAATNQNTGGGQGHTHTLNNHTHTFTTSESSNLPPYVVTYMWKRTA